MDSLPFKKIKFFTSKEPPKKKSSNEIPAVKQEEGLWQKSYRYWFIPLILFVGILAYFLSYLPSKSLPLPGEGEIATTDIIAPVDLTIRDDETTEEKKEEAASLVLPVYSLNLNIFLNTEEKIRELFSSGRALLENSPTTGQINEFKNEAFEKYGIEMPQKSFDSLVRAEFPSNLEENLISLIGKVSAQGIILSKNLFIHNEQEKGLTLIRDQGRERSVRVSEILDITEGKEILSEETSKLDISQNEKSFLTSLSHVFISDNITFNNVVTERRKEEARNSVETIFYTIKKGKVIVRKGDDVKEEDLNLIRIINQNLREKPSWLINFAGTFFLFGLLFVILWYYLKSISVPQEAGKNFVLMGIVLIISLLFYKLSIFLAGTFSQSSNFLLLKYSETYNYAFPFQFGTLLFAFLTTIPTALVFTVMNSLLVGYLFKFNFSLMLFCMIGGFASIYGIKYYGKQKRTAPFRAGIFLVSPINTFIIVILHLIRERFGPIDYFTSELMMGVLGGILSAALAFLFLPVVENLFSFLTQSRLFELTNSDLPEFRQMAIEAPGSYHHSLVVSSLAEEAAEEIKLDPMLVKVGALYHDIGKTKMPEYFIENRVRHQDMHKDLKPSMSRLVIINHVKEGIEIAKKLKLPKKVIDIIEQHHGDSLVRYFYEKAKEEYDPEMQTIGEESYRYPGPKPRSKEAGLIMLADSVEAASRSLKEPTNANLKKVVNDILNNYMQDGQLDDSNFSIKELRAIAESFYSTLHTIYHHRVEYPGFDFENKKKKKNAKANTKNDRNHKPAE